MKEEVWKDIKGYEGLYQVSNRGRIKSLAMEKSVGSGNCARSERILSPYLNNGYICIKFGKDRLTKHFRVHRLVAIAFIPNPENLPCINHKDEDKTNNNADNLEFCTVKYNNSYGTRLQRKSETQSTPVVQKTKDGEIIKTYKSQKEAGIETGIWQSNISYCCLGRAKSAGGFIWERGEKNENK